MVSIITWNICSDSFSDQAPAEQWSLEKNHTFIIDTLLAENVDILCLQEMSDAFLEVLRSTDKFEYILKVEVLSHKGRIGIFVKNEYETMVTHSMYCGPCAAIEYHYHQDGTLKQCWIATCHLATGNGRVRVRGEQFSQFMLNFAINEPMLVCGDINVRPAEEPMYRKWGFVNAIGQNGEYYAKRFTWDFTINKFFDGIPPIRRSYDRMLIRAGIKTVSNYRLIGNVPINSEPGSDSKFYASDHFGIAARFD